MSRSKVPYMHAPPAWSPCEVPLPATNPVGLRKWNLGYRGSHRFHGAGRSRHGHRRWPAAPARAGLPYPVPGPHQPHVPARGPPPRARLRSHRLPHPLQRPRPVPPPRLRLRPRPRRLAGGQPRHGGGDRRAHLRRQQLLRGAVPGAPGCPAGGSWRQRRRRVPGRGRAPADPHGRGAAARRADAGAAHRQRRLLPQLHGHPDAVRQGLPPRSRVAAGLAGEGAPAVPRPGPGGHHQQPPRARSSVQAAGPGRRGSEDLGWVHTQHLRCAGDRRHGGDSARPRRRAGVRRRPAPQALPSILQQPPSAGPRLPRLAGRAGPGVGAVHQLRQPGEHERRGPGRGGVGRRQQPPAVPVGAPAGPRPRRRPARRVRRGDRKPGRGGGLGAAGGGAGARGRGRVLDARRVELGPGGRVRGRADAVPALLRRPDGQREVRGARVARRVRAGRRRPRAGRGGAGSPAADAGRGGGGD